MEYGKAIRFRKGEEGSRWALVDPDDGLNVAPGIQIFVVSFTRQLEVQFTICANESASEDTVMVFAHAIRRLPIYPSAVRDYSSETFANVPDNENAPLQDVTSI